MHYPWKHLYKLNYWSYKRHIITSEDTGKHFSTIFAGKRQNNQGSDREKCLFAVSEEQSFP